MSAAAAASIRARRPMSWSRSASGSASTARRWPGRAAWSPRSTAPRSRTATTSISTASSSPMTARWVVVQQGMKGESATARRYHWHSEGLTSFVDAPHAAIEGAAGGNIVNLTDRRAAASRDAQLDLLATLGPDGIAREFSRWRSASRDRPAPAGAARVASRSCRTWSCRRITTSAPSDVIARRLHGSLAAAAERGPSGFRRPPARPRRRRADRRGARPGRRSRPRRALPLRRPGPLLLRPWRQGRPPLPGAAPRLRPRRSRVLKSAVRNAKLGREEELAAIKRLDDQARSLERLAAGPSVES